MKLKMFDDINQEYWDNLNKKINLIYVTFFNGLSKTKKVKIYKTMKAASSDISICLKNGGAILNVCNVKKGLPVLTLESYKLSIGDL